MSISTLAAAPAKPRKARAEIKLDPIKEMDALAALKESLADLLADDPDMILDLAEGETSLFEVVDALLAADALDEGLIDGAENAKRAIGYRVERFKQRQETRRGLLERALLMLEQKKLERPSATISITNRKPKVEVEDESKVPSAYFVTPDPVLSKKLLNEAVAGILDRQDAENAAAIAEGREAKMFEMPAGVRLSNGSVSLTIRRR